MSDEKLAAAVEDAFDSSATEHGDWFNIDIDAFLLRLRLNGYEVRPTPSDDPHPIPLV